MAGDDESDPLYDLDAGTREHYVDAALYDFEYRRRRADVNFYRERAREQLARSPGPILELGCGTGRLSLALVRDGHTVVGLDLARPMLARAALRAAKLGEAARRRLHLVQGDMRRFAFSARFPLVVCPFHALQHLYTRTEVVACFQEVRRQLAPGGLFLFDVMNPDLRWLTRDPRRRWARTKFRHPETGEALVYSTNHTYDPITQITYVRLYYEAGEGGDRRTHVVRLAHRQFFPAELELLVASSGLRVVDRWGSFAGDPLDGGSESQIVLCRSE